MCINSTTFHKYISCCVFFNKYLDQELNENDWESREVQLELVGYSLSGQPSHPTKNAKHFIDFSACNAKTSFLNV